MGSPYRHNASPARRTRPDHELVRFETAMSTMRQRGLLRALALLAGLAALTFAPMLVRARDIRPPTRDRAVVRPAFWWSAPRTLHPVSASPLPWPWGPPCDPTRKEACD